MEKPEEEVLEIEKIPSADICRKQARINTTAMRDISSRIAKLEKDQDQGVIKAHEIEAAASAKNLTPKQLDKLNADLVKVEANLKDQETQKVRLMTDLKTRRRRSQQLIQRKESISREAREKEELRQKELQDKRSGTSIDELEKLRNEAQELLLQIMENSRSRQIALGSLDRDQTRKLLALERSALAAIESLKRCPSLVGEYVGSTH